MQNCKSMSLEAFVMPDGPTEARYTSDEENQDCLGNSNRRTLMRRQTMGSLAELPGSPLRRPGLSPESDITASPRVGFCRPRTAYQRNRGLTPTPRRNSLSGMMDSPVRSVRGLPDVGPIPSLEAETCPDSPTCSHRSLWKIPVLGSEDSFATKCDKLEATKTWKVTQAYLHITNNLSFELVLTIYIAILFLATAAYVIYAGSSPRRP